MAKMSNRMFRSLLVSGVLILSAFAIIGTVEANKYSASLNFALGRGDKHVVEVEGISGEDTAYYDVKFKSAEESRLAASEITKEVENEGAVLLKNQSNALPIAKKSKVTPFGFRFVDPFYGGTGSANIKVTDEYIITPEEAFTEHFEVNNTVLAKMKAATAEKMIYDDGNEPTNLSEYNASIYTGTEASCNGTTGVVYIARPGTEGYDLNSRVPYSDGTKTELHLTVNEKNTIAFAKANCEKVVVAIISPNPMEIYSLQKDAGIAGIIWLGLPGSTGYDSFAKILDGEVNPSGKLSDLWYSDFASDPTYANRISTAYTNPVTKGPSSYIEYEEGIYVGYRYYETRFAEDNSFPSFGSNVGYDEAVLYPFGYGLNYEDDKVTQTLSDVKKSDGNIVVTGKIKNDSSRDVKEVVQVYYGAPYYTGGIEKSAKELAEFDKVAVGAGQEVSFTITFSEEDMASYDYKKEYSEKGSYVLEHGDYEIFLGKDSHSSWGSKLINYADDTVYATTAKKGVAVGKRLSDTTLAENLFDNLNNYSDSSEMKTLSRKSFADSYPDTPATKAIASNVLDQLKVVDEKTDKNAGTDEGSKIYKAEAPTSEANNGTTLSNLRAYDYDDPLWDDLLDNLSYGSSEGISKLLTNALYQTSSLTEIGKVETNDNDGTAGLTANWGGNEALAEMFGSKTSVVISNCYPCAPIQAATFNTELMERMGEMIGQEGIQNNISGWYAPGLNLHRTPYGGRNFEYYSEDPILSSHISAASLSGAYTGGGLYAYIKHFALNETDDNRSSVSIWTNEQVARQLYFKAFEETIKRAEGVVSYYDGVSGTKKTKKMKASTALMTSMNYIGMESPTNSYSLLTTLLRDEWGFKGMVETDFTSGVYRSKQIGYRIGNDVWMAIGTTALDLSTTTAQWAARNAVHNVCYAVVNSNAYNNVAPGAYVYYDVSPWQIALTVFDVIVVGLAAGAGIWMVIRHEKEKSNPGDYKSSK